LSDISSATKRL